MIKVLKSLGKPIKLCNVREENGRAVHVMTGWWRHDYINHTFHTTQPRVVSFTAFHTHPPQLGQS